MDTLVFQNMVGRSKAILSVYKRIRNVAELDIPVLISGESGAGKELVARAIHTESGRRNGPFQAVNTGAIAPELIASEFFGHEKGAFTGAAAARKGFFEAARGGTLFLDEIGTMSPDLQVSLLRVLETQRYTAVGGTKQKNADVRILAATSANLKSEIQKKTFRSDLYYRLNVYPVQVPPLRKRRSDIPLLAYHFLTQSSRELGKHVTHIDPAAMRQLKSYGWPGNVRELRNVILRLVVNAQSETVAEDEVVGAIYSTALVEQPNESGVLNTEETFPEADNEAVEPPRLKPGITIHDAERELIRVTLRHANGNRTKAARLLGISRKTIYKKLQDYDIQA